MITTVLSWIWIGSGLLLILFVLLHSPKGDGMGGLAASGSTSFTSASSAETHELPHGRELEHRCAIAAAVRSAVVHPPKPLHSSIPT